MTLRAPIRYDPCDHCPFRKDQPDFFHRERAADIAYDLIGWTSDNPIYRARNAFGKNFHCHETTVVGSNGELTADPKKSLHCAGAAILMEKVGQPNTLMQVAGRMGLFSPFELKNWYLIYDSFEEFIAAQNV